MKYIIIVMLMLSGCSVKVLTFGEEHVIDNNNINILSKEEKGNDDE